MARSLLLLMFGRKLGGNGGTGGSAWWDGGGYADQSWVVYPGPAALLGLGG